MARKGKYGTIIWQESSDDINTYYYINYPADAGDLNGDGLNDVLIGMYKYDSYTRTYTLKAKKGIDGTNLWQESISGDSANSVWIYGYPVEDLNGDKLNDILVKKRLYDYNTDIGTEMLKANKGIDGTDLWQESISGRFVWIYGISAGDLNGDRPNDVLVSKYNYPYSTIKAKIGKDGTDLWKKSKTAYMNGYLVSDLNGDKLNDVLIRIRAGETYDALLVTIGKNGIDMWRAEANDYLWWDMPDDVNGNGNKDILLGSYFDGKMHLVTGIKDTIPPRSITNLKNVTYKPTYIKWTWKDPSNLDFSKVMVYLNGKFKTNVIRGKQFYNATGLQRNTWYKISTRTVDYSGNINRTWVNKSAKTSP